MFSHIICMMTFCTGELPSADAGNRKMRVGSVRMGEQPLKKPEKMREQVSGLAGTGPHG